MDIFEHSWLRKILGTVGLAVALLSVLALAGGLPHLFDYGYDRTGLVLPLIGWVGVLLASIFFCL